MWNGYWRLFSFYTSQRTQFRNQSSLLQNSSNLKCQTFNYIWHTIQLCVEKSIFISTVLFEKLRFDLPKKSNFLQMLNSRRKKKNRGHYSLLNIRLKDLLSCSLSNLHVISTEVRNRPSRFLFISFVNL